MHQDLIAPLLHLWTMKALSSSPVMNNISSKLHNLALFPLENRSLLKHSVFILQHLYSSVSQQREENVAQQMLTLAVEAVELFEQSMCGSI